MNLTPLGGVSVTVLWARGWGAAALRRFPEAPAHTARRMREDARVPRRRRRLLPFATAALALTALAGGTAVPATALPPAPVQTDCLTYTGRAQCIYNIGFIEFRLSQHVLHVGDKVSGTYTWGFSPTRSGSFLKSGPGLRLIDCSGRKNAGLGTSGSRTCTWKAVGKTGGWQTSLGMSLGQNASLGTYTENDFYIVLGREMVIEGDVKRQETEGNPTGGKPGIPGVQVKIHGPQSRTVTTNANGYYVATVKESGRYRVTPRLPGRYGGRKAIEPESRVVKVSSTKAARADFVVDDDLEVSLSLDRDHVPATGYEVVTGTISAARFGEPVPNLYVSVIPFRHTVSMDAEQAPVPARFCNAGSLTWPNGTRGLTHNQFPFDLYTDAAGVARFTMQTGTVPGDLVVQVWAKDASLKLRTKNITKISDTRTIVNEALPGSLLGNLSQDLGRLGRDKGIAWATYPTSLADQLGLEAGGGLAFDPIQGSAMQGVLVHPATTRIPYLENGVIGDNDGTVITPAYLDTILSTLYGGFSGAVNGRALPALPSFGTWKAGSAAAGWSLVPQTGNVTFLGDPRDWRYFGFPYPKSGGC